MTPTLDYTTRCRVPGCTKTFVSSALEVPIIGQPDAKVVKFVTALMDHMQKKHPQEMNVVAQISQQFLGFIVISQFEIEDPKLLEMRESVRALMAKMSRRFLIPDADIKDRVARLELDPDDEEGVGTLLLDMRDLLTEQGRYAPLNGTPANSPLVTS
jgi:hypothetical protein